MIGSAPEASVSRRAWFDPAGGGIARGPAYTPAGKLVATSLMVGLCWMGWKSLGPSGVTSLGLKDAMAVALVLGLFIWTWLFIVLCQVELSESAIRQGWGYWKRVDLQDVTQVKYVLIPGLSWLFAPRLIVRARGGVMPHVFQLADPAVRKEVIRVFGPDAPHKP